eukprot:1922434-Ditylum_brightwellii.AAC.1
MGHYANMCKTILDQESTLAFILGDTKPTTAGNFTFAQIYVRIPKSWIILDTGSTSNILCNRNLLRDIHETDEWLGLNCNSGWSTTNLQGILLGFDIVWFSEKGIANILSFAILPGKYMITYNKVEPNVFAVHKDDKIIIFCQSKNGLYYHETENCVIMSEEEYQEFKKKKNAIVLVGDGTVETVAKNMSQFSDQQ